MRDMLLAKPDDQLSDIMLMEPVRAQGRRAPRGCAQGSARAPLSVYPVVSRGTASGGLVRGETLFANRAIAISGQSGSMVGVDKEERLGTPVKRSLLLRHPGCRSTC
jgi:magnesium transporter